MTDTWATSWAPVVSDTKKPLKLKSHKLTVGAIEGISVVVGQKKVQVPLASNKSLKQLDLETLQKNLESIEAFCIWRESGNDEALMILNFDNLDPVLAVEESKSLLSHSLGQFGFCPINQDGTKRLLSPPKFKQNWDVVNYEKSWTALVDGDLIPKSKPIFCSILQVVSPQILLDTTKLSATIEINKTGLRVQDGKIQGLLLIEGDDEDELEGKISNLLSKATKWKIEIRSLSSLALVQALSVFQGLPKGVKQ